MSKICFIAKSSNASGTATKILLNRNLFDSLPRRYILYSSFFAKLNTQFSPRSLLSVIVKMYFYRNLFANYSLHSIYCRKVDNTTLSKVDDAENEAKISRKDIDKCMYVVIWRPSVGKVSVLELNILLLLIYKNDIPILL